MSKAPVNEWTHQQGGPNQDEARAVSTSADGSIYIAGFTDQQNTGLHNVSVSKYNSNGSTLWTRVFGSSGQDVAESISADDN